MDAHFGVIGFGLALLLLIFGGVGERGCEGYVLVCLLCFFAFSLPQARMSTFPSSIPLKSW